MLHLCFLIFGSSSLPSYFRGLSHSFITLLQVPRQCLYFAGGCGGEATEFYFPVETEKPMQIVEAVQSEVNPINNHAPTLLTSGAEVFATSADEISVASEGTVSIPAAAATAASFTRLAVPGGGPQLLIAENDIVPPWTAEYWIYRPSKKVLSATLLLFRLILFDLFNFSFMVF